MAALSWLSNQETEADMLERLRAAYEQQGYVFVVQPTQEKLPSFLGSHQPDAIASKGDLNIVIEVKSRRTRASDILLSDLQNRIAPHKNWKLDVIFVSEKQESLTAIPAPHPELIRQGILEVEELLTTSHARVAFMLAWSLLEAAHNRVSEGEVSHSRSPGQVIQSLAMRGFIGTAAERSLRSLSDLHNRIVHGDLGADVSSDNVEQVLSAINETLALEAQ